MDGVLTEAEAARFVETAERIGLEHQGSRGAAFGEVGNRLKLVFEWLPPAAETTAAQGNQCDLVFEQLLFGQNSQLLRASDVNLCFRRLIVTGVCHGSGRLKFSLSVLYRPIEIMSALHSKMLLLPSISGRCLDLKPSASRWTWEMDNMLWA